MPGPAESTEPTGTLLSDVVTGLGRLVKGELMLARAEAGAGLRMAVGGLVKIVLAAILALVGLNVLAGAAVAALAEAGLGAGWAALIVGLALCVLALVLALAGRAALRLRGLWPDRALRGVRRDAEAVRAAISEEGVRHV
ncbi:phage holin family protein [Tabrizicola soli]|uniref:Phage holin family protein n=1 Tax=Tabrizicola soli TaxID=2185115 RepID=A0ABV7DT91_9RHOB|nr:phage holin family protein [Tabrizicola soli]